MKLQIVLILSFYFFHSIFGHSTQYYERRFNRYYNIEEIDEIASANQLTRAEVMTSLDLVQSRIVSPEYTSAVNTNNNRDLTEQVPVNSRMISNQQSARLTSSISRNNPVSSIILLS